VSDLAHADVQRSYWYMQGEYEQDESRSDAVDEEAFVGVRNLLMQLSRAVRRIGSV